MQVTTDQGLLSFTLNPKLMLKVRSMRTICFELILNPLQTILIISGLIGSTDYYVGSNSPGSLGLVGSGKGGKNRKFLNFRFLNFRF